MFDRSTRVALAVALFVPAIATAQSFEYAAGTSTYKVTQSSKVTQEAMGQKNEMETSMNNVFTSVIQRSSKDTLFVTTTIDSISAMGPMGPPMGLEKLVGLVVKSKISPMGAKYVAEGVSDDSIPGAGQVTEELGGFLPKIKGAMTAGSSWVDTTTGKVKQGGLDVDRRVISTYTVAGDTTVGTDKAWKLNRESTTAVSGSGAAQGQPMTMEGTSTSKGFLVITQKGVFLGGEGTEDANIKIVLAANGMEVGITQATTTKIAKVK